MESTVVNSRHNVWPESLSIDNVSDCDKISGFITDPIKAKAKELLLHAKSVTKNQDIFEEVAIEEWITSDEITDQYKVTGDQIIDSIKLGCR